MKDTYTVGENARVQIENVGDEPYLYQLSYAACAVRFYDGDSRRFVIPPGTHCDLISFGTINPGDTKLLFEWELDECVKDNWGCVRSERLPPGTYTLTGRFKAEDESDVARASASFELLPSSSSS